MIMTAGSIKKGAVEIREVYVKKWAAEYVREQLRIPDCLSLIRLLRGEEQTLRAVHEHCAAHLLDIGKT